MSRPKEQVSWSEYAFRGVMTVLSSLVVAGISMVYTKLDKAGERLAHIESSMVTREQLETFNDKISSQATRIAVLEVSCKKHF